jgi:hypothetical protein
MAPHSLIAGVSTTTFSIKILSIRFAEYLIFISILSAIMLNVITISVLATLALPENSRYS